MDYRLSKRIKKGSGQSDMLSEDKQNLIRKRIIEGSLLEDIAREVGCSTRTILNYKKKMPVNVLAAQDTGDDTIVFDTSSLYTQAEEKYIKSIKKSVYLYEDVEEGWTFHYDKENATIKTNSLWWMGIAYPESVKSDWIERLERLGFAIAISPLHDKDVWLHDSPQMVDPNTGEIIPKGARYKAGDKKKAHWHFIIICSCSTSFKEINNLIRPITNGPYLEKCRSIKNTYDYFTHETDAAKRQNKYVYEKDEIIRLNNFHVVPNKYEVGVLQCEIANTVIEKGFTEVHQIVEHYRDQPEIMTILWAKPGLITSLLRSLYKKKHPESKVQLTKEITQEEYDNLLRKGGK